MQNIKLSLLKEILTYDTIYSVPKAFEITVMIGLSTLKLIQIIEKDDKIELVDSNYNHHIYTWDAELDVTIYKRVEYYIGE
jgi:predicted O-methyltransferase YrrM